MPEPIDQRGGGCDCDDGLCPDCVIRRFAMLALRFTLDHPPGVVVVVGGRRDVTREAAWATIGRVLVVLTGMVVTGVVVTAAEVAPVASG